MVAKITLDFGTGRKNFVTEYGYNAWGDITSVKDPRGNVSTATSDYKRRTTQAQSAAPFNFVSKLTFDKNDNLVKTERQTGVPAAPWQTSTLRGLGDLASPAICIAGQKLWRVA